MLRLVELELWLAALYGVVYFQLLIIINFILIKYKVTNKLSF